MNCSGEVGIDCMSMYLTLVELGADDLVHRAVVAQLGVEVVVRCHGQDTGRDLGDIGIAGQSEA